MLGMVMYCPRLHFPKPGKEPSNVTELIKEDIKIGTGEEAVVGKMVEVHYTGWLYDPAAPIKRTKIR